MSTKQTKTEALTKLKAKYFNQLRNLAVKQFKGLSDFHEKWNEEHKPLNTEDNGKKCSHKT